jgi:hypothetical protein
VKAFDRAIPLLRVTPHGQDELAAGIGAIQVFVGFRVTEGYVLEYLSGIAEVDDGREIPIKVMLAGEDFGLTLIANRIAEIIKGALQRGGAGFVSADAEVLYLAWAAFR